VIEIAVAGRIPIKSFLFKEFKSFSSEQVSGKVAHRWKRADILVEIIPAGTCQCHLPYTVK